jgi:hypothetical protein
MNRVEKERAKKRAELCRELGEEQVQKMELADALAKKLHQEMFPEEYDYMMDSISDANDRRRGINPMSAEYTAEVNARRSGLGVSPLGKDGMPVDESSWEVANKEALKRLG